MDKIKIPLVLISCLIAFFARANNPDSLYGIWQDRAQSDSTRVAAYSDFIQMKFLYSMPDSATALADELIRFAKEREYTGAEARGYRLQGIANAIKGDYQIAKDLFLQSQRLFQEIGDRKGVADNLRALGNIYLYQGNRPMALQYAQNALHIFLEINDKKGAADVLNNLGNIYWSQDNYDMALKYALQTLSIYEEIHDQPGIAKIMSNIANIYTVKGNYDQALEYNRKALEIYQEFDNKNGVAGILSSNGAIYYKQGNFDEALVNALSALEMSKELGDKQSVASNSNNIGSTYKAKGNLALAQTYCKQALDLAEELGALNEQQSACKCLYTVSKKLGKEREALRYFEKMQAIENSLQVRETDEKLRQMEFEKKMLQDSIAKAEEARLIEVAHQEEVREKNQTRNVLIGSSFLLLLLAGGLFSRWRYVRKSRDMISKEKDRSENLLLNILPAEIAEELKQKGRADARDFEMVSILFTDFKGFTEASAKLSAQDLVAEINECFEAFDGIMEKYGIEKIKTIGDAYMAAGGLPVPTDASVKNTVLAALEMQAFIAKRKAENDAQNKPAFEMRVGIHTGPVVAGIVGVKKFQYDIWGDTVNTAARMESSGETGKVNISQNTYLLLKESPEFTFESRGKIQAKGKGEIEMYFAERA